MLKTQLQYNDNPASVSGETILLDKLTSLHEVITVTFGFVDRIAISIYNQDNDELKTFIASCHGEDTLKPYACHLIERPSLLQLVRKGKPSVIKNLNIFSADAQEQLECGITLGFPESYAMPVYEQNQFYGFVFFNSKQAQVFDEGVLFKMDLFGHMISLMVMHELRAFYASVAHVTVQSRLYPSDSVSSAHIERTSRYARLIKSKLSDRYAINNDLIEQMCVYRPIHGGEQIGLSDSLLIKAGCLTEKEYKVMKVYTELGREMIDRLIDNFNYEGLNRVSIISNMAEYHHGALAANEGQQVSLENGALVEAKIVAIADVFDVLSNQCGGEGSTKVFEILKSMVVSELDRDCISALAACQEQIEDIKICYK
jgi:HD-GYP domain-containing protein (c-di-GMP phosphodiesterase class II)